MLAVRFYLLLEVALQEGHKMYQRHVHMLLIFSSLKVDSHLSFLLLCLFHESHHLLSHFFTFRVAKIKDRPADANIRGSFLYLPFETVIWSLLDSLHILYQLHHMVSSLIHHMFAVSIDFIKLWDSYLGPVYRRVNVKLHCMMHHFQFHIP